MKKNNKYNQPIDIDSDVSFEEAMQRIAVANKEEVEKAIEDNEIDSETDECEESEEIDE